MRRRVIYLLSIVAAAAIVVFGLGAWHHSEAARKYVQSSTPTIFVHGWGSSAKAETKMTHAAKRAGAASVIVRADVDRHGKVFFNKKIPAKAVNPIVEVNLEDNKLADYQADYVKGYRHGGTYVKNVVLALERQHYYKAINLVGHSMGNLEIINYINDNAHNRKLPQVNHLVAIAGHYNGIAGEPHSDSPVNKQGKPHYETDTYRPLLTLRKSFPRQTRVLNIFGNKQDGSNSDGAVPVNSAKSLKYLVKDRAKSYQEVELKGANAQHSRLHENNPQVNRLLIQFLWGK